MTSMLEHYFAKLGVGDKERKVYLALAEVGKATASLISKNTNIPRATVYGVLENLSQRGLISQEQSRGSTLYLVNGPTAFVRMIEREKEELQAKEKAAIEFVELIAPYLRNSNYSIPKLQFFEGKQNIEAMLYEYLPEWRKSYLKMKDPTLWGYQDNTIVDGYRKWHDHLWKTSLPNEKIRLFTNDSATERELSNSIPGREVRILPEGIEVHSSIWVYGEYLILCITRQKPHYAVQLKDPVFSDSLRAIFQLLWRAKF